MERTKERSGQTRVVVILVTVMLLPVVLHATSLLRWPVLVNAEAVSIEITICDDIYCVEGEQEPLFAGQPDRKTEFRTNLETELRKRFAAQGLPVDPDADAGLLVSIYGRSVPAAACGIEWVYSLEVLFWEGIDDDTDFRKDIERDNFGAVSDQDLEGSLLEAVLSVVETELSYRQRNLAHFQEEASK